MASAVEVRSSKTFPAWRDRNEYLKHPDVAQLSVETLPADKQRPYIDPLNQRPDFLDSLKHRSRSGFNDAMSVALVVDAMVNSFPKAYIRATYLTLWLNRSRPDFIWEPITVGRIMGEIVDVAAETFAGANPYPVDRGTDWRGHYVVIGADGTEIGRLWLMKLLNGLLPKCAEVLENERDGVLALRNESVWSDVDTSA